MTMAELHRTGRYDRMADGVERVTGQPPMSVREFVSLNADEFGVVDLKGLSPNNTLQPTEGAPCLSTTQFAGHFLLRITCSVAAQGARGYVNGNWKATSKGVRHDRCIRHISIWRQFQ